MFAARLEQSCTVALKLIAELNAAFVIVSNESRQASSTLQERFLAKVLAVKMEKVESVENDCVGVLPQCRLKGLKVGGTIAILNYGFAIYDCRFAAKAASSADDGGIVVAPLISVAAEHTGFAALDNYLRAVAIMFDFMNPVPALWWLIDWRSKLWLDESEFGGYAGHRE
jgi:hypothetical protein